MVFLSQNHITFIFIKKRMSHDLFAQMAYREEKSLRHVAMVAKFLDDKKPEQSGLFQTSSILFNFI